MFLEVCLYYLSRTARNRVLGIVHRMRQPKYLVGVIAIAAYVYFFFVNNPVFDRLAGLGEQRQAVTAGIAVMTLVQVISAWLIQGRGIAFKESEVQFLFPRPFTRFQLLMFKWVVMQVGVLFSGLVLAALAGGGDAFHYLNFAAGFVLLQAVVSAHGLLFGLCRSQFKTWLRYLPGAALLTAVPICAVYTWEASSGEMSLSEFIRLTETRPLATILMPFKLLVAPMVTQTPAAFFQAALWPGVLLVLHLLAIKLANLPFEDDALAMAAKIQEVRSNGLRGLRSKKKLVLAKPGSPWKLAPVGYAWKALVWKNVLSITRFSRQTIFRIVGIVFIVAYVVSTRGGDLWGGIGATRLGFVLLMLMVYLSVIGPSLLRVDLRIDIPHFDVLKSMPIRARSLIFGEVMGTVTVLWLIQVVFCTVAAIFITADEDQVFTWEIKGPVLAAALVFLLCFDFVLLTAENLIALWMPGFVRLGRGVKPSLDQMGPYILGAAMKLTMLFVLFLPAALVGIAIGFGCAWLKLPEIPSIAIATVGGSIVLALAGFFLILLSEARYDRFDLSSERTTTE